VRKKPAAVVRLKKLAEHPFDDDNFQSVIDSLRSESDRAAVIIAGSLLDDELAVLIRKVMRPLSAEDRQRLFGFDGPAGTFSSRILLAYALRLIDANDRQLLNIIREMRNACAHSRMPISFETQELRDVSVLLFTEELRGETDSKKLRALFIFTCALLLNILVGGKTEAKLAKVQAMVGRKFREKKTND
jgi:hypothetical protein